MRVLVCGATGCVGRAVVRSLRSRGHQVVAAARSLPDAAGAMRVDFMQPVAPAEWAGRLRERRIDAVVNCVGILMPSASQTFERVHAQGPAELFRGAALAGVQRVVQISALGVADDAESLAVPYLHSKLRADDALAALPLEWTVLRPSLLYGPGSQSAALFATLASLPAVSLPGRGQQTVAPMHVHELAEIVMRLLEGRAPTRCVHELGGAQAMSYRAMLQAYRGALQLGPALWLPVPMPLMKLGAALAEALPQQVYCRDTLRLLERGSVPGTNATAGLLGRAPMAMAQGLSVTPPAPWFSLRAELSPAVSCMLRAALAFMWIYTSLISALLPEVSGVLELLARCGFSGDAGVAALVASCALNLSLGGLLLWRPSPWLHATQIAAIVGYTLTAAINMPELTLDHCAPLVKNLPVLAAAMLLWLAQPQAAAAARGSASPQPVARPGRRAAC